MKKAIQTMILGLGVLLLAAPVLAQSTQMQTWTRSAAMRAVGLIPKDVRFRKVAVGRIIGDDGSLARDIEVALKNRTRFELVERRNLKAILREQGLQLSDIFDPHGRIKPGRLKGVEALFYGKILDRSDGWLSRSLRVHLTLANVQTGTVYVTKTFEFTWTSPYLPWLYVAGAVVLVLIILCFLARRRRIRRAQAVADKVDDLRPRLLKKIDQAEGFLSQTQARLYDAGETGQAQEVRQTRDDLKVLRARIDQTAVGDAATDERRDLKRSLRYDKKTLDRLDRLESAAERIFSRVSGGRTKNLESDLNDLRADIARVSGQVTGRNIS